MPVAALNDSRFPVGQVGSSNSGRNIRFSIHGVIRGPDAVVKHPFIFGTKSVDVLNKGRVTIGFEIVFCNDYIIQFNKTVERIGDGETGTV